MSLDLALRLLEVGVGFALVLRAAEHLRREPVLFGLQALAAAFLLFGECRALATISLWALSLWQLHRYHGPYNGGADKMALLILTCLVAAHLAPTEYWQELALAYLALQVVLSYVISGWVKLRNPDWRSGRALADVFAFSAYPVAENLRALSDQRRLLRSASWAVILLEVAFPLTLLHPVALIPALLATALFHLANACLFGLNRFFWIWIAAYPALIWFQGRMGLDGLTFH